MEFCNGGNLDDFRKIRGKDNKNRLQLQEARFLLREIVLGLDAIHSKGFIHRNLQLKHILLHFKDREN